MTDKLKDDLPLVQEINDLLRVCETDNDLARCIMDVLKERGLVPSPPVPDDVAEEAEEALDDFTNPDVSFETVCERWNGIVEEGLERLIRAASTPSAEVQALRDALSNILNVITPYAGTHVDPQHRFAMIELARKALNQPHASLPEPNYEAALSFFEHMLYFYDGQKDGETKASVAAQRDIATIRAALLQPPKGQ